MIWSSKCIDETAGFDLVETTAGITLKPRKIGRYVYTLEELEVFLNERK